MRDPQPAVTAQRPVTRVRRPATGGEPTTNRRDDPWLQALTGAITSVATKTHSMQLYELMGVQAHAHMRPDLFGVLSRIRELQPVRVSDVARQMDYERSTVSRHVAELVAGGCVDRTADAEDGRVVILQLTAKGQTVIDQVYEAWLGALGEITEGWSAADRAALLRLLTRFDQDLARYLEEH